MTKQVDCELIFYSARKTSFCQRSLSKCFSHLELKLSNTSFATNAETLAARLIKAFSDCDVVFIVGGFACSGKIGIESIMSNALAYVKPDECKKLENKSGADGYVIKSGKQLIVLLPDEPQQIEAIMRGNISHYMQAVCR